MARNDIRLMIGFLEHPKTVRLRTKIGPSGVLALIRLWCWAALNKPKGILAFCAEDVELIAGWDGKPGEFVAACIAVRFLDRGAENEFILHDWADHQPWVFGSTERSEHARQAAYARHGKGRRKPNEKAQSCSSQSGEQEKPAHRSAPFPSPLPSPTATDTETATAGAKRPSDRETQENGNGPKTATAEKRTPPDEQEKFLACAEDLLRRRQKNEPLRNMVWKGLSDRDLDYQWKCYAAVERANRLPAGFPPPPPQTDAHPAESTPAPLRPQSCASPVPVVAPQSMDGPTRRPRL
jgi:hypothetical protein